MESNEIFHENVKDGIAPIFDDCPGNTVDVFIIPTLIQNVVQSVLQVVIVLALVVQVVVVL